MRRLLAPALCVLLLQTPAHAFTGTEGASFLEIPVGAKPAALGGAYIARAADAYAPTYNPAGLGFLQATEVAGMHLEYLENIRYEHASLAHPFSEDHGIGLSVQYFNPGDTPGTDLLGNPTGDFSGYYGAYALGYGRRLGERFGIGISGKFIHAKISDTKASAFGGDVGAFATPSENMTLAAVITNLGTPLKFIEQKDALPMAAKLGLGWAPVRALILSLEGEYARTKMGTGRVGLEWLPIKLLSLRAGYKTDTTRELSAMAGMTTGVGIHAWGQEFDYAWVPLSDLGSTHYFSLILRFGHVERARRNLITYEARRESQNPTDYNYEPDLMDLEPTPSTVQTPDATGAPHP